MPYCCCFASQREPPMVPATPHQDWCWEQVKGGAVTPPDKSALEGRGACGLGSTSPVAWPWRFYLGRMVGAGGSRCPPAYQYENAPCCSLYPPRSPIIARQEDCEAGGWSSLHCGKRGIHDDSLTAQREDCGSCRGRSRGPAQWIHIPVPKLPEMRARAHVYMRKQALFGAC